MNKTDAMMILAASLFTNPLDSKRFNSFEDDYEFAEKKPSFSQEEKDHLKTLSGKAKKKYLKKLRNKYENLS